MANFDPMEVFNAHRSAAQLWMADAGGWLSKVQALNLAPPNVQFNEGAPNLPSPPTFSDGREPTFNLSFPDVSGMVGQAMAAGTVNVVTPGSINAGGMPGRPYVNLNFAAPTAEFGEPPPSSRADIVEANARMREALPGDMPDYLALPDFVPNFDALVLPDAPDTTLPAFAAIKPAELERLDVEALKAELDAKYTEFLNFNYQFIQANAREWTNFVLADRGLLAQVQTVLGRYLDPVSGGGTAMPEAIAQAIFNRAAATAQAEYRRATDTVLDEAAARGLSLPNGVVTAVIQQGALAQAAGNARVSTEIAEKNFELEQHNMQFMLKLAESIEGKLIDVSLALADTLRDVQKNSFELAKARLDATVQAHQMLVTIYDAQWRGFVAEVQAYQAQIQGIESRVRVFETLVRGELAKTEVNKTFAEYVSALANANRAIAEGYRTRVEAALAHAEVAKSYAYLYDVEMRGYIAQVQAYSSQIDAYRARINGETAKLEGYSADVSAYEARLRAEAIRVQAVGEQNRAIGAAAQAKVQAIEAAIRAYAAQIDAIRGANDAEAAIADSSWKAETERARAQVEVWRAQTAAASNVWEARTRNIQTALELSVRTWEAQLEQNRAHMQANVSAAQVAGGIASSAMSGITSFAGALVTEEN